MDNLKKIYRLFYPAIAHLEGLGDGELARFVRTNADFCFAVDATTPAKIKNVLLSTNKFVFLYVAYYYSVKKQPKIDPVIRVDPVSEEQLVIEI